MMTLKKILEFLEKGEKWKFFGVAVSQVITSIVETFTLMLLIPYIGVVSGDIAIISRIRSLLPWKTLTESELFIGFSCFFIFMMIVKSLLQFHSNFWMTKFPYDYYRKQSERLLRKYLNQPFVSYVKQDTGTLVKHCTQTSYAASQAILQQLQVLSFFFIVLFLFAAILIQDFFGALGLISLFGLVSFSIYALKKRPLRQLGRELVEDEKKAFNSVQESLHLFKEVKLYHLPDYFAGKFQESLRSISQNYRLKDFLFSFPTILIELVAVILFIAIVAYVYLTDAITSRFVAGLIFYAAVGRRILPAINHMTQNAISLQHSFQSLEAFENELHSMIEEPGPLEPKTCREMISFCNVGFSYLKDRPVLVDATFDIPKNSSVAFVGPSGGGKSTAVDLLIGLLRPDSGNILVDGCEEVSMRPFQHQIGYVPQSIALINESIARNIAIGETDIDEKRLQEAIAAAHLESFISSLPDGVHTFVGDRGIRVSGGQMQRIGIARALYQQPDIIIFDEATSSLDNLSEMAISESITELMGKKTIVAVAHRLSTVKNFDRIYVVDKGRVIAKGTHLELVKSCLLYRTLEKVS